MEQTSPELAMKYAQAAWDAPGLSVPTLVDEQDPPQPRDPTNEELAANYVNRMKQYHKDILAATRVGAAGNATRVTEAATVAVEGTAGLGDMEN